MPTPSERRHLILRHADIVASLGGTFLTGPDVNTSEADMDVMAEPTHMSLVTMRRPVTPP